MKPAETDDSVIQYFRPTCVPSRADEFGRKRLPRHFRYLLERELKAFLWVFLKFWISPPEEGLCVLPIDWEHKVRQKMMQCFCATYDLVANWAVVLPYDAQLFDDTPDFQRH